MDHENSYFQEEYISEEQYISYNDEENYGYDNNSLGDGENSEELGYEEDFNQELRYEENFDQEFGYEEEFGERLEVEEFEEEARRELEEDIRGEGWEYEHEEPEQVYQGYQLETVCSVTFLVTDRSADVTL